MNNVSMSDIPWGIIAPVIVLQFVLMVVALIACVRAEQTNGPKWLWVIIIVCISIFGPVAFFVAGRRNL